MPILKQEYELSRGDFDEHPVWCGVHGRDESEDWYESSDEATFRPWEGPLPVSSAAGLLLVAAEMRLSDGSIYPGACYSIAPQMRPSTRLSFEGPESARIVSDLQPRMFLPNGTVRFWEGMLPVDDGRQLLYSTLAKKLSKIFPITFVIRTTVLEGGEKGVVAGFCRLRDLRYHVVEQTLHAAEDSERGQEPATNPFALEPLLEEIATLAREEKFEEAFAKAGQLISDHPGDSRCWTARATIHARRGDTAATLTDATQAVDRDPNNRDLYPWVCRLQVDIGNFDGCLRYSDAGLAAKYGSWAARAMYEDQLIFLGARALYELGQYQAALDRLNLVPPLFGMGKREDRLMTKKEVVKACETALRRQAGKSKYSS